MQTVESSGKEHERATWNNSIEFLMSCIAVSVGFGNIWRFPFTAYENGGGAFLIPYVILLFLVGKPFYFLEMIIGQFTSNSSVKVWGMSPGFVGNSFSRITSPQEKQIDQKLLLLFFFLSYPSTRVVPEVS